MELAHEATPPSLEMDERACPDFLRIVYGAGATLHYLAEAIGVKGGRQ